MSYACSAFVLARAQLARLELELDQDLSKTFVLAENGHGEPLLSVHVKRSYWVSPFGECRLSAEQVPLLDLGEQEDYAEQDIVLGKRGTDLIVLASAYAPPGAPVRSMLARISCGAFERTFWVHGDRHCSLRQGGELAFSEPEPFEVMPLCHARTYGGSDPTVTVPASDNLLDALLPDACIYPRNPSGRGYAVTGLREHIDGLALPNIENPADPLTPERLVCGAPENWWRQPLPWGCGPYDITWYPRSLYIGGVPRHLPEDDRQIEEVRRGWVAAGQRARYSKAGMVGLRSSRIADAASPGMTLPSMRGDEVVRLSGMSESRNTLVELPGTRPSMQVRFRGRTHELTVALQRVVIDAEAMTVSLVWQAAWQPPTLWTVRACEVLVDGEVVQRLGSSRDLSPSRYSRRRY